MIITTEKNVHIRQEQSELPIAQEAAGVVYEHIADLLQEEDRHYLLYESRTKLIIWTSCDLSTVFGLTSGVRSIDDFDALFQLLSTNITDRESLEPFHWRSAGTLKNVSTTIDYFDIYVKQSSRSSTTNWVKFQQRSDDDRAMKTILEEQEHLFNLSKSISIGEMATTLAHEINQPLGTITNVLSGSQRRVNKTLGAIRNRVQNSAVGGNAINDPAAVAGETGVNDLEQVYNNLTDIERALQAAEKQSQYIHSVIDRMRSFAGQRAPKKAPLNVVDIVEETIELGNWLLESHAIQVTTRYESDDIYVNVDKTLITQVLMNLYRNSIDAMKQNLVDARSLNISILRMEGDVKIEIEDNGEGLGSLDSADLFTPFNSTKSDGTGIGLNICRSFIELHNGRLWITSGDNGGCKVHLMLPHYEPDADTEVDADGQFITPG